MTGSTIGRFVLRPGHSFNLPTNLIVGPGGDLFVTDGYGNARVHRSSADGEYLTCFMPYDWSGQFQVPHGIARMANDFFVADRENRAAFRSSPDGELPDIWTTSLVRLRFMCPLPVTFTLEPRLTHRYFPVVLPRQIEVCYWLSIFEHPKAIC